MSKKQDWQDATAECLKAADTLEKALLGLEDAQQQYQEWQDNLPENLEQSPVGEKLTAVCDDIDIAGASDTLGEIQETLQAADEANLPLGFGRD
jgi:hypothetical protein